MRAILRTRLTEAMKDRDTQAVRVYRTAIAAIDNAEAVPLGADVRAGPVEASPVGAGAADVPRARLTAEEEIAILRAEVEERRGAADLVRSADADRAAALDRQADLLAALLASSSARRAAQ
jgi:uncharacterized protein YqeY